MIIYKGKQAVCGIQLTIDRVWRYIMTDTDKLTVKITDCAGHSVINEYNSSAVDSEDKMITADFSAEQTSNLISGLGKLVVFLNDLVVVQPQRVMIKEV